jgi:hypothetical protein
MLRVIRRAVLVGTLCACNQIFGIAETRPLDAGAREFFDAPIDAPFECPATGGTPTFSRQLNQLVQTCIEYSVSETGRAAGFCNEPAAQVSEGPAEGPLAPVAGLESTTTDLIETAKLSPEGDELYVRIRPTSGTTGRFAVYTRTGSGFAYSHDITLPSPPTSAFGRFGTPSRGPTRRMFVQNNTGAFLEIQLDSTGASTLIQTYDSTKLGGTIVTTVPPELTPDGLHFVVILADSDGSGVFYADRASLAEDFSTARRIAGVPTNLAPFLVGDCGRLYFPALGYVFWVLRS